MVSPIVVHVIGFTAFILILSIVIGYVGYRTYTLILESEKKTLEKIAESISLQIQYVLWLDTNISISLRYPLESTYDRMYNIELGSGNVLKKKYPFLSNELNDNALYVLTLSVDNRVYGYSIITMNSTKKPIYLSQNPSVFSSGSITVIEKIDYLTNIRINVYIKGVKTS
ncbi:MAG: hypothetical protein QXM54_00510 [Desulfurococcaceae archaeon]|uniref:Uncharacterized protein n=1 Tax=Staphylothermus marinus TaxID=2280 RepID=A0A7J3KEA7_STAMA